jgi:proline iminopeptidase
VTAYARLENSGNALISFWDFNDKPNITIGRAEKPEAVSMKNKKAIVALIVLCSGVLFVFGQPSAGNRLWPQIKPYKTEYLKVSDLHEIFYQEGGTPKGKPVMVLHGGPGGGCPPAYFRYFNPEIFHIVLHDQRGCGQSKPLAELRENTTQNLVGDIEKLRIHLGLGKVILFGGSWGSTLALAYAERYPQNVSGMVLRGVFTSTKDELDHYYHGGTAWFFPEIQEAFLSCISRPDSKNYAEQFLEKLKAGDPATRERCAKVWAKYEGKIAFLEVADQTIDRLLQGMNVETFALLENHYMANGCFLKEGELLNNAGKLADIPVTIINGRYDTICPPLTAYRLHKKLPKSQLIIVERAGHSASEPGIEAELVKAMRAFE